MNKIILADSQAIFRAGTAKVLAMDEDLRIIAQCTDLERMYHAITTFPDSIVLFAASLQPDFARLGMLLETTGSRGIVVAENNENAAGVPAAGISRRGVPQRHRAGAGGVRAPRGRGRHLAADAVSAAGVARRRYGGSARARPADAERDAHCGPDRAGLQESRDRASGSRPPSR